MRREFGFTLIELLIVVAIIAILAAIAVPNFLEAQTRSKVSRVKADMRSAATGIEAYVVDWNRPPLGNAETNKNGGAGPGVPSMWPDTIRLPWLWAELTTPVAYISFMPIDPFAINKFRKNPDGSVAGKSMWVNYEATFQYFLHSTNRPPPIMDIARQGGVTWYLFSLGPAEMWGPGGNVHQIVARVPPGYPNQIYDPTNGTMSTGFIVRSNRGQEPF